MCHGDGGQWFRAHTLIIIWDCAAEDYMTPPDQNQIEQKMILLQAKGLKCDSPFTNYCIIARPGLTLGASGAGDTKMRKCN